MDQGNGAAEPVKKPRPGTFSSTNQPKRRRAGDKIPRNVKQDVIAGLAAIGSDGKGKDGLKGYVTWLGTRHPKQGARLLERLLPPSVVIAANTGPPASISTVNVVSIPSDRYLSSEEIQRLQGSHIVDHAPDLLEAPAPEPIEQYTAQAEPEAPPPIETIEIIEPVAVMAPPEPVGKYIPLPPRLHRVY